MMGSGVEKEEGRLDFVPIYRTACSEHDYQPLKTILQHAHGHHRLLLPVSNKP